MKLSQKIEKHENKATNKETEWRCEEIYIDRYIYIQTKINLKIKVGEQMERKKSNSQDMCTTFCSLICLGNYEKETRFYFTRSDISIWKKTLNCKFPLSNKIYC